MEFGICVINHLVYIFEEVFWLKETVLLLQSFSVFALVWWFTTLRHRYTLLLFLSAFLGSACAILGDLGYWNDNDVLKHIAPVSLYFVVNNDKERRNDILLFAFHLPLFFISYEVQVSIFQAALSILSHLLIFYFVFIARKSKCLSIFISIVIGLLYNYTGDIASPGTNDILVNPMLITLYTKGIDYYTKKDTYTLFLKSFWAVLLCFAYLGSWIFIFVSDYYNMLPF
ncbi:MAG: hypothetical protein D8M57_17120 [Candidatus Scalindua sp. AMX11]|nr:MAG: hypothetical protein DWQ00_02830 [Candidatus Scalindua sp.]NOG84274.1 hypothetical protein [Planctomycetota bacterium]RZV67144.1 MAG: hypothetical protein EX341_17105 [Candidatus Scalindua sp. SCAELEC01]TDE63644.1 MAG: hypothetical protein D8M57_17120 [Candidatus Scalindua sp. AMX11]